MKAWKVLFFLWAGCLLTASLAGPGLAQQPKTGSKSAAAKSSSSGAEFDKALLEPAALHAKAPEAYEVKFTTTKGDFVIKVTRAWAPLGADRFYNLAVHHFYDGANFFRVLPGFVVQFGLSAYPQVNEAWSRAPIKDDPVKQSNHKGFVTYAMAGPNTRTTQIFINYGENTRLDSMGFAPFGEVTRGMDVVQQIYSGYGETPRQDRIESQGRAYLERSFPKLDSIKTTTIISPEATQPAGKSPKKSGAKQSVKKPA